MTATLRRIKIQWQTLIEMYSSINIEVTEVKALAERLRARTDLLPLKARGLKRFAVELKAISEVGLPWKAVWRILRDVGYQGTYRQFVAMANRLTGKPSPTRTKTKNLPAPTAERQPLPLRRASSESGYRAKYQTRMADSKRRRNGETGSPRGGEPGQGCAAQVDQSFSSLRHSRADVRNDRTIGSPRKAVLFALQMSR